MDTPAVVRDIARADLQPYTDTTLGVALKVYFSERNDVPREDDNGQTEGETEFRRAECNVLKVPQQHAEPECRASAVTEYGN